MKITKKYNAKGHVYGRTWMFNKGSYPMEQIIDLDSKEDVIEVAEQMLKDGTLDSGFGFESLLGAVLDIEEKSYLEYEGEIYTRSTYEFHTIGEIPDEVEENIVNGILDGEI